MRLSMALLEHQRFILAKKLGVNNKDDDRLNSDLYSCCQIMKLCNETLVRPMECHDCDFNNKCKPLDQRSYCEIRAPKEVRRVK